MDEDLPEAKQRQGYGPDSLGYKAHPKSLSIPRARSSGVPGVGHEWALRVLERVLQGSSG